jgi:hypothetical protein
MTTDKKSSILVENLTIPAKSWCWQPAWSGVGESIYSTLGKFEALNALNLQELGELFVTPKFKTSSTGIQWRYLVADLRITESISKTNLRAILKLDSEKIQSGFTETLFPNSQSLSSNELRWCPLCIKNGFHASAFQLNYVFSCPIHNVKIRMTCPKCKSPIPYMLRPQARDSLFQCWTCHHDLAPAIRMGNAVTVLKKINADALSDYVKMLRFGDQLPTLINACRNSLGKPNLPMIISKGQAYRQLNGFEQFVADVLTHIADNQVQRQRQFHFIQPYSIFSPKENTQKLVKATNQKETKKIGNQPLQEICSIYKAIKRHIFRRLIKPHKVCYKLARNALWWDIDGERIKSFCPIATAFIRWRMHWEGCRIPANLDRPGYLRTPYGLVGWLAGDAPIASNQWNKQFESWVHSTIFGCHCVESFYSWLEYSTIQSSKNSQIWNVLDHEKFPKRHWAICGYGATSETSYLFMQRTSKQVDLLAKDELNHIQNTAKSISNIRR